MIKKAIKRIKLGNIVSDDIGGNIDDVIDYLASFKNEAKKHLALVNMEYDEKVKLYIEELYGHDDYYDGRVTISFDVFLYRPESKEEKDMRVEKAKKIKAASAKTKKEKQEQLKKEEMAEYERLKKKFESK